MDAGWREVGFSDASGFLMPVGDGLKLFGGRVVVLRDAVTHEVGAHGFVTHDTGGAVYAECGV